MKGQKIDRICIVRLSALGDIIHTLVLVNGLRREFPKAEISWILQPLSCEMIFPHKAVDHFYQFDSHNFSSSLSLLKKTYQDMVFDLMITPQVSLKASLITSVLRSKIKLGYDFRRSREFHWFFMNRHIPHRTPHHVCGQFMEFLEFLGIDTDPVEWNLEFTQQELEWRDRFFKNIHCPVAGCIIASSNPLKDWNIAGYAQVIDYVQNTKNIKMLLIGGPSQREAQLAEEISRRCKTPPVTALERPIRNTLLQISKCQFIISPDTGPLHAAVALGVPTIGLYGYSNPRRCGPVKFHELLIDKFNEDPKNLERITRKVKPAHMQKITPEEVISKVDLVLEQYPQKDKTSH